MNPPSSAGPVAGTPAYCSMLEREADDFSRTRATNAPGDRSDVQRLVMLLRPYGPSGLLDLCTLLVLCAVDLCPTELRDGQGRPDLAKLIKGNSDALTTIDAASSANARLHRGAVTADDLTSAEEQAERIIGLEPVVAAALQTRTGHAKARRNVRRALSEQGDGVREATAVFGILSDVMEAVGRKTARSGA
ncbi:hypothetical protein OG923_33210 (plasmid) [Streptomyces halstedii]|uniref:hypothetical protein n=1 Tax=Streptomyces halstedii TaxID=1944 RepID=UPI002F90A2E7